MTKTGWVTLRALTKRIWRGGINRVIGAGLRRQRVRGRGVTGEGRKGGAGRAVGRGNRLGLPSTVLGAATTYAVPVLVLPPVVIRPSMMRLLALGLAVVACCLGVTGCAQFNKALGQQQANIYFQASTPVAFKLKVRAACNNLPHVKASPLATGVPLASAVDIVTYNTTGAGVSDIARLEECVNKFAPQVQGVDVIDSSDDS